LPRQKNKRKKPEKAPFFRRRKVCKLCTKKIQDVDYKDTNLLHEFLSERGKILPRKISGACAKHQRIVTKNIKIARNAGLLPFIVK